MNVSSLASVLSLGCKRQLTKGSFLEMALPPVLRLLFLFYPIVTNTAFEAFSCYTFDQGDNLTRAFLVVDVSIECTTTWGGSAYNEEHAQLTYIAYAAVAIYPIGLLLLNGALLYCARKSIQQGKSTTLTRATRFLHREYEPGVFYWELVEMFRRLLLVGIMVLVLRGQLTQLVISTVFCLMYLLIQMQAQPYRDSADDYLANACSFSMSIIFLCCIMFKISTLTELKEILARMSPEQQVDFNVPSVELSWVMFGSVIAAGVCTCWLLFDRLAKERIQMGKEEVRHRARTADTSDCRCRC